MAHPRGSFKQGDSSLGRVSSYPEGADRHVRCGLGSSSRSRHGASEVRLRSLHKLVHGHVAT